MIFFLNHIILLLNYVVTLYRLAKDQNDQQSILFYLYIFKFQVFFFLSFEIIHKGKSLAPIWFGVIFL